MTSEKFEPTRRELLWVRTQLIERLRRIREDAVHGRQPLDADSADRAQQRENDEVLDRLDESTTALRAQYERALRRLDAGQYGICEGCGFVVEAERLHAMPQATTCTFCAAHELRAA
jgi:DnaK suppressor protein